MSRFPTAYFLSLRLNNSGKMRQAVEIPEVLKIKFCDRPKFDAGAYTPILLCGFR